MGAHETVEAEEVPEVLEGKPADEGLMEAEPENFAVGRREELGGARPSQSEDAAGSSYAQASADAETNRRLASLKQRYKAAHAAKSRKEAANVLLERFELFRGIGELDKALADADLCVSLTPKDARAWFARARARLDVGGLDADALSDLHKVKRLDPHMPDLCLWARCARHWASLRDRPNFYRWLGVPVDATTQDIHRGHKRMVLRWHPDKPGGDVEQFRKVREAWEVLGDEETRCFYDFGENGPGPEGYSYQPPGQPKPPPPEEEYRLDPDDKLVYTYDGFMAKWLGEYSEADVIVYWMAKMIVVPRPKSDLEINVGVPKAPSAGPERARRKQERRPLPKEDRVMLETFRKTLQNPAKVSASLQAVEKERIDKAGADGYQP
eukprot:gnl/TRDRNA2_/TRDRNA2_126447_c1_seq1.p1 gnl/TRDRNA2_/TRDRNA2_126447_c1~~gnl/TRDRNA2_/TRDRNA2_126447_c1_seq1.p1  ORF type:complete len:411 (+),score=75.19 gnl/TRDRNA2_/TRDRNA2_126447_c1_seq1:90-1235(+)